jgi:hypothetical protein
VNEQLFQVAPKLSERQIYVYELTADRQLNALTAGIELHRRQRCPYCRAEAPCQYAEANGREVLEALKRKGLLKRDVHHVYRRADSTSQIAADSDDWGGF